jgi:hypothetical protein
LVTVEASFRKLPVFKALQKHFRHRENFAIAVNRSWQGPQQGMKTAPNGSIVLVSRERDKRSVSVWRLEARL